MVETLHQFLKREAKSMYRQMSYQQRQLISWHDIYSGLKNAWKAGDALSATDRATAGNNRAIKGNKGQCDGCV